MSENIHCITDEELSAHIDGDLTAERSDEVATHVASCLTCKRSVAELETMMVDMRELSHARPGLDLWRRIDEGIDAAEQAPASETPDPKKTEGTVSWIRWLIPVPVAAAAVIIALLTVDPPSESTTEDSPETDTADLTQAMAAVEKAESAYRDAIESLEDVYISEKASFSPETLAVVEKSLAEIDAAIERSREAMMKDPMNVEANRVMLAAYRQKMDFLYELVGPKGPAQRSVR